MNYIATALVLSAVGIPIYAVNRWNRELTGHGLLSTPLRRIVNALGRLFAHIAIGLVFLTVVFGGPIAIFFLVWAKCGWQAVLTLLCVLVVVIAVICVLSWRADKWR